MPYFVGNYCGAVRSKVVTTKLFPYRRNTDMLPIKDGKVPAGYYPNEAAALVAVQAFDTEQLPLFVNNTIVQFYYSDGSGTLTEATIGSGHYASLSSSNKTAVPHYQVSPSTEDDTIAIAKGAKEDVLTLYNIADEIKLKKPVINDVHWSDSEFALLIINLNNTFGINLPTYAIEDSWTVYRYNKVTGRWEQQSE